MFATGDKVIFEGQMATVISRGKKAMWYNIRTKRGIAYVAYDRIGPPRSLWQRIRNLF